MHSLENVIVQELKDLKQHPNSLNVNVKVSPLHDPYVGESAC